MGRQPARRRHAVDIDARALLPHVPPLRYPGQSHIDHVIEVGAAVAEPARLRHFTARFEPVP